MVAFIRNATAPAPTFDQKADRFNMLTWGGRTAYFFNLFSPFALVRSLSSTRLSAAEDILEKWDKGEITTEQAKRDRALNQRLWAARMLCESTLHDDGSTIPWYGRFSSFLPFNIPICAGMISMPTGPPQLFWQWANQTYNVVVNYHNSNKSAGGTSDLIRSYLLACGCSLGIAAGLSPVARRYKGLGPLVPYIAVASAGAANIGFTRSSELSTGIPVFQGTVGRRGESTELGRSAAAGTTAVTMTAFTRVILPIPILLMPPAALRAIERTPALAARCKATPAAWMATQLAVISVCIWAALPAAIGLFPKFTVMDDAAITRLEPTVKDRVKADGGPVWYVRGL
eukprot:TRINITY_DN5640_c0_g1_i1.p1 TRINITY_DN5640_c0_g1~~TRINITY_DN5640_c0_g1_i1.p1  ORF type:complete len:343 (+),score=51.81 TRINITY_DN5640_c0_g1_i1:146-1174(+)